MIERTHEVEGTRSVAVYSDCETYRYALTREWDAGGRKLMFVMLNPSTASELKNDPTVERCERRARALGFGAFRVTNLFAFRATDPADLRAAAEPIGAENETTLRDGAVWADQIVAAWGVHGTHMSQATRITALLRGLGVPLFHLGLTRDGHPRHPLYVSYAQRPVAWTPQTDVTPAQ